MAAALNRGYDRVDAGDCDLGGDLLDGVCADGKLGAQLAEALQAVGLEEHAPEWPAQLPPEIPALPPSVCGVPKEIFQSMCQGMMGDIHRNHLMTPEEKKSKLRSIELRVPERRHLSTESSSSSQLHNRTLRLVEDPGGVLSGGATGSVLWPAAGALVEWLDREVADSSPRTVVELGAGLGAAGLFLAKHKRCQVVLTDVQEALLLLNLNVQANYPHGGGPDVVPFNWGDSVQLADVQCRVGEADLVIGSDVTYRPELLEELLVGADKLLSVRGRLLLTLQDRDGEARGLEAAVQRGCGCFRVRSCTEAPSEGCRAVENSTLGGGQLGVEPPKVWLYELERDPAAPVPTKDSDVMFQTPADIEAEFARLTGVKVDPIFPDGKWLPRPKREPTRKEKEAAAAKEKAKQPSMRQLIVQDYLDRGLAAFMCDFDEDLKARIDALPESEKPRSEKQRRCFAEDHYAALARGEAPVAVAREESQARSQAIAALTAEDQAALNAIDTRCQAQLAQPRKDDDFQPPPRMAAGPVAKPEDDDAGPVAKKVASDTRIQEPRGETSGAKARVCADGLEWTVDIDEVESKLLAVVTFGEEVWRALEGSAGGGAGAFREAVDFQLAAEELQVRHVGATVLELKLPRAVEAEAASAKICGRRRRVTVRAPLACR